MAKQFYIRFNPLPKDGKSVIYTEDGLICGKREGVSVFNAELVDDKYTPVMPEHATVEAAEEFIKYTMTNPGGKYNRLYLVTGDLIDYDEYGCPVITNVCIVEKLNMDELFPDRRNPEDAYANPKITDEARAKAKAAEEEALRELARKAREKQQAEVKANRVDEFVDNMSETAKQLVEETKEAVKDATEEVQEFVEEVRTSKAYNTLADKANDTAKKVGRFTRATLAFAKALLENEEK